MKLRKDVLPKVTGRAVYANDIVLPGMVYAKVVRSTIPSGRIRSIDASAALEQLNDGVAGAQGAVRIDLNGDIPAGLLLYQLREFVGVAVIDGVLGLCVGQTPHHLSVTALFAGEIAAAAWLGGIAAAGQHGGRHGETENQS